MDSMKPRSDRASQPPFRGLTIVGALLVALSLAFAFRLVWERTLLSAAVEFASIAAMRGDQRTLDAFLDHGVDVDGRALEGRPLIAAASRAQVETVEALLARGADVNALDASGDSALAVALDSDEPSDELIGPLRRHGGRTLRGSAAEHERAAIAERALYEQRSRACRE